jgi:hypothetical protein
MSQINICNQALLLLGEKTIQSLEPPTDPTDDTSARIACDAFYESAIAFLIQDMKPSFARVRVKLTTALAKPAWEFDNAYQLPQDYLVVVERDSFDIQGTQYRVWRVEGRAYLTNNTEPNIMYMARDENTEGKMDGGFIKTAAAYLAYEMAYALTNSDAKVSAMYDLYTIRSDAAIVVYGQEGSTRDTTNDQLTVVR